MTDYDDIVSRLPIQQLAQQVGEDPSDVERAIHTVLPALLGGLRANAADPGAAASLTQALGHHAGNLPGDGPVDLDQVDTDDGAKIARHVFGDQTDQVINQLGGVGGASSGLIAKLLPILAPIVLAYVGKQMSGSGSGGAGGGAAGGVLGSILGSILSGAASGTRGGSSGSNIDLGDILGGLGGLLGGGTRG
jgi:hypothetical protein